MSVTYYKRYRMDADVRRRFVRPRLPADRRLVGWSPELLLDHAEAKHAAFCSEVDARVFHCLGDLDGCLRLMEEIASKPGFMPHATWLAEAVDPSGVAEPVGTVQAIRVTPRYGSIQNVGVAPWARGDGLGPALVTAAMIAMREEGLLRATLEVTATNTPAVRMYESLGFRRVKTTYRSVPAVYA